ncbi:MAG: polyphosphate kinase 1 [Bdellovibrionota bacterium]
MAKGKQASKKPRRAKKKKEDDLLPEEAPQEFLNRDLERIEFNARVLSEALDSRTPLLERVRFLGIFTSNLDEFFMKRIGNLKRQVEVGVQRKSGGLTPVQLLAALRARITQLQQLQSNCYQDVIQIDLAQNGVHLLSWDRLTDVERGFANQYFRQNIFPVLTPLAVDPGLPFPFISNLSTSLGVTLKHPEKDEKLFARIKVPKIFPQWVQVRSSDPNSKQYRFVALVDMIIHNLKDLFPDMEVLGVMPFRITRNAEVERDEGDEVDDLLEMIAEELKQRRFAEVVRLEHGPKPDPWMLRFLMDELELTEAEVFEAPSLLDYTELKPIGDLPLAALKYDVWAPLPPARLIDERESIFSAIREGDLLVHHPFESFGSSVERFLKQAVDDPKVLAIKMTLYRTGDDSPFIPLLIRAAERGKQVVVLIELQARFDEERNIHWAQELENAGVHVVYGVIGLKTHAKVALVVRQEGERLRAYAHFGTGNYHRETAKLYTDLGLFTCKPEFTEDAVELFHFLTGRSLKRNYRKLLVAPINMKDLFIDKIRREAEHAKAGKPARIVAKCNSLEDANVGRALYEASQAGVKIDLIVRGFCSLRPKVPGLSENIRVISVIGRFLEHSRLFFFQNGEEDHLKGEYYIGSADWMYRNLLARIETVVPIEDRPLRARLWEICDIMLKDRRQAWEMESDGTYKQFTPTTAEEEVGTHRRLMLLTSDRVGRAREDLDSGAEGLA